MGSLENNIRLIRNETVEGGNTKERIAETFDNIVAELGKKVDKVAGKILSSNDFTNELRQKLEGLQQVDTSGLLPKGGYTGTAQDLKNLIDAINRILQSDDTQLDQLQEIVTYIKQNKHILSTLGISNIAGLVEALAAKAEKDHHHDERYAPITHHHNQYALRTHRHNWDDIDGKPNNLATTEGVKTAIDETINLWKRLVKSPYGETILSNLPIIIREIFLDNTEGSNTNLWTANNELNVGSRNIGGYSKVRSSGYNINGKDNNYIVLAGGNSIHKNLLLGRKGYISDGGTLNQQDHSNSTIFVRSGGNFELSPLESLTSCSFIKVFDGGNVTFTCEGKTIIMKGDTQFNGSKGSTAVVSIHNNDCYIRISNV